MPSLMPLPKIQFFNNSGTPLAGGFVYTYLAGSISTLKATYTDSTALTPNANPVVLDSSGRASIWLDGYYKIAVYDSLMNLIYTQDNVSAASATSAQSSQWTQQSLTLTYIAATQFSCLTDQTALFISGIRVKAIVTAGTIYGTVVSSASGGAPVATTVVVTWDSGSLDSGLSTIYTGIISPASIPISPVKTKTGSYVVSTTDINGILEMNSASAATFTLPAASGVASGAWYTFKNVGAGICTIVGTIDGAANLAMIQYTVKTVYSDGTSWFVSGDAMLTYSMLLTGTVAMWPSSTVPSGYLECNGALVLKATYPGLYAVLQDGGATCIYGETSTGFYLPDYRGIFLRGWDHTAAKDPDAASRTARGDGQAGDLVGTKQSSAVVSHTHSQGWTVSPNHICYSGGGGSGGTDPGSSATGSTGGNETRPININIMFIIKT